MIQDQVVRTSLRSPDPSRYQAATGHQHRPKHPRFNLHRQRLRRPGHLLSRLTSPATNPATTAHLGGQAPEYRGGDHETEHG